MKTKYRSRDGLVLSAIALTMILQANKCPEIDQAKESVRTEIERVVLQPGNQGRNWRAHWKRLKKGTEVSSFDGSLEGGQETYRCGGRCVLIFLDLDPFAHFSHRTQILVFDPNPPNGSALVTVFKPTIWWPTIFEDGWQHPVSVFNTVTELEDPSQVFHVGGVSGELPAPKPRYSLVLNEGLSWPLPTASPHGSGPIPTPMATPTPTPPGGADSLASSCEEPVPPVWAILVNGYNDLENTFDEDVAGMYAVLRGFEVSDDRIMFLSPQRPVGVPNWRSASKTALVEAFSEVEGLMESCKGKIGTSAPHFLLFWSSHGTDNILFCNRADGNQDNVNSDELSCLLESLEKVWTLVGGETELSVTVVIEACQSGSVGQALHASSQHRRIFASATSGGGVSYRDIDYDVGSTQDPNPADSGSETIWGYVEAFGSVGADTNHDGKIQFDEAVQYANDNDVSVLAGNRQTVLLNSVPTSPLLVHGAWNTSVRASATAAFTTPSSTTAAFTGGPLTADVLPGETVKLEVEVSNVGGSPEVGALALRLFRNDQTVSAEKWLPWYYEEDNLRTTVMISGLPVNQPVPMEYTLTVPETMQEGEEMRFVINLDSAQPTPVPDGTITVAESRTSEIVLRVGKKCKSICCWWRDLWN